MPKIGAAHEVDSDFSFISIKGGALMYKGPSGRVLTAAEVADRHELKGADAPDEELEPDEAENEENEEE